MKKFKISNLKLKIVVGYLYGDLMNIYGDIGNIIALKKRAQWRGIDVVVKKISIGSELKKGDCDIFFFGGGQDIQQEVVAKDLLISGNGKIIKEEIEKGVPLLSVCGGYQLLGEYYQPHKGAKLEGVSLFPAYTVASDTRMIGNIVIRVKSSEFRMENEKNNSALKTHNSEFTLVGFENHSGKTYLKKEAQELGKVKKGFGNNGEDKTEGCIYKNAIGCYMHGSLLPKNPQLADWLLEKALEVKYGKEITLEPLNDELEHKAQSVAIKKFS